MIIILSINHRILIKCYLIIRDKEYAKDITQETYARALESHPNTPILNKRAFLYRVAKNIIIDQARKNNKNHLINFEEERFISEDKQAEEKILQINENQFLLEEIQKLPKKRKQAFVLHVVDGYSRKEIAVLLNISVSAVEKHISRASLQIKESLENNKDVVYE